MILGLLMIAGLGLLWAGVGACMATAATRRVPPAAFYAVGSCCAAVITALTITDWRSLHWSGATIDLVLWTLGAGAINAIGQAVTIASMNCGPARISWTIAQSAMILPFLAGVWFWRERPGPMVWLGLSCIVMALVGFARCRTETTAARRRGHLLLAFAGMILIGGGQVMMLATGQASGDPARLRPLCMLVGMALVHGGASLALLRPPPARTYAPALFWALLAATAYALLYTTIDHMQTLGLRALIFPCGITVNILVFSFASRRRLRETAPRLEDIALAGLTLGLLLMASGNLS